MRALSTRWRCRQDDGHARSLEAAGCQFARRVATQSCRVNWRYYLMRPVSVLARAAGRRRRRKMLRAAARRDGAGHFTGSVFVMLSAPEEFAVPRNNADAAS